MSWVFIPEADGERARRDRDIAPRMHKDQPAVIHILLSEGSPGCQGYIVAAGTQAAAAQVEDSALGRGREEIMRLAGLLSESMARRLIPLVPSA